MVTKEDLQEFHRFADQKLESGKVDSLLDLASEWESDREATVTDIRQSHANIEAGNVSSVTEAFADARRRLSQR